MGYNSKTRAQWSEEEAFTAPEGAQSSRLSIRGETLRPGQQRPDL